LPPLLILLIGHEMVHFSPSLHFGLVALASAAAVAAAVTLMIAGAVRRDGRAVLVGGAFTVMSALLCLHGMTTPGILVGMNGVVAFTGGATLPVGAALLALSAVPRLSRSDAVRPLLVVFAVAAAAVLALGAAASLDPMLVPSVPKAGSPLAVTVLCLGLACFALLVVRALRTYLLTRRLRDLLVVVGISWLMTSLGAALLLGYMDLGWWLGHGFEVLGIFLVAVPVALDLLRGGESRPLVGDLRAAELVASAEGFLGSQVRALTVALAEKDAYTLEHTRRVAMRAVQVGEELGLSPGMLRALAVGGLLHDIGKLSVPDSILRKPGPLTDAEFAVVQEHAERGRMLLHELGGYGDAVLRLVRDHHERLDGSGYPRGLGADEIELDARILAVCDVYDALRSKRVYREAWSHERAMALLRGEEAIEFDARCVDALDRVLGRERAESLRPAV
jgi:HD-GYP domain-containing protein (c-di-GMP phosphodiesterase class II)